MSWLGAESEFMDLNKLQGEYLLSKQILSSEIVARAYGELANHSGDLCAVLVEHGLLSQAAADQARYAAELGASGELRVSNQIAVPAPSLAVSSQVVPTFTENSGQIAGYRILSEIGSGGMGTVYRAYSTKLGRECALKTLRHGQEIGIEESERFRLEAETMARLDHPHIVKVFDFGEEAGVAYLAMDLVAGVTLKELLREEGVPDSQRAAEITMKCAKALSYAHRHAILHRDVKPDNIMIRTETGSPLLTDFGLAKRVGGSEDGLTQTGAVMGTPVYMSPEQAMGSNEKIDQRSDIYSLGATLYELLTGEKVFPGGNFVNLVHAIVRQEPLAPSRLVPKVDKNLEIICLKCLEKAPEDRYWTAGELAEDLQRYLNDETILAKPQTGGEKLRRWLRRHRSVILGAWLIVLIVMVGGLGAVLRPLWTEWSQYRSIQTIEEEVRVEASSWNLKLNADLDKMKEEIDALIRSGDHSKSSAQPLLAALEKKIEAFNRKNARDKHFEKILDNPLYEVTDEQRKRLLENARRVLDSPALAARAASLRADLYEDIGDDMKAGAQRALAYKYGPNSEEGVNSLLALANSLCARREYLRASLYYRKLSQNTTFRAARSKAYLGLAEIFVNQESFGRALTILKNKMDWTVLSKTEQAKGQWLKNLAEGLNGRVIIDLPDGIRSPRIRDDGKAICLKVERRGERAELSALTLGYKDGKAVFSKLTSVPIPGSLIELWEAPARDKSIVVVKYEAEGKTRLRYYQFEDGQFKLIWEPVANDPFSRYRALCFGDMDGNGEADVLVQEKNQRVVLLNFATGLRRVLRLEKTDSSYFGHAQFYDFDKDGCDELVLALIEWNDYSAMLFRGGKDLRGSLSAANTELIGRVSGCVVVPGENPELLMSADRAKSHDIGLIFGPDLKPDRPDALWRWFPKDGQWTLEAVLKAPFDQRERCQLGVAGLLLGTVKDFPKAYCYHSNVEFKRKQWVLDARVNDWRVRWEMEKDESLYCFNVDGDDDHEVIRIRGRRLIIDGVAQVREENVEDKVESGMSLDQYELGLTLLESGRGSQARILFEELLEGSGPLFSKPIIQLALARCFIQSKNYRRARAICQEVNQRSPAFGREALSLALDCAEQLGDYRAALSDLKLLLDSYSFSPSKRQKLRQRQLGLAEMGRFETVFDLNDILKNDPKLYVELSDPNYFQFDKNELVLYGHHFDPAELTVPMNYNGRSFRLSSVLNIEQLDSKAEFQLALVAGQKRLFFARFIWEGSGDPSAWRSWLKIGTDRELTSIDCDWFDPKDPVQLTVTYRADKSELQISFDYHSQQSNQVVVVPLSIPKGKLRFFVGNKQKNMAQEFFHLTRRAYTRVRLQSLSLSSAPRAFRPLEKSEPRWLLGRVHMRRAQGADEEALRDYMNLPQNRWNGRWRRSASFQTALTAFRLKKRALGLEQLKRLQSEDPGYFAKQWRDVLFALSRPERLGLAAFLGVNNEDDARRKLEGLRNGGVDPFEVALYLSVLGTKSDQLGFAGWTWFQAGAFRRANQCFAVAQKDDMDLFMEGVIACQDGRFRDALKIWKKPQRLPGKIRNQVSAYSILMENRLLKRAQRAK